MNKAHVFELCCTAGFFMEEASEELKVAVKIR